MNERTFTLALGSLTHSPLYYVIFVAAVLLGVLAFKAKSWRNRCRDRGVVDEITTADKRLLKVRVSFALAVMFLIFATMDFGSARLAENNLDCIGKVKKITLAQTLYASDNDDMFVVGPNWVEPVSLYLSGSPLMVMHCRMAKGQWSYAVNKDLDGYKLPTFESPSATVVILESDTVNVGSQSDVAYDRHVDRASFGFADGHSHFASLKMSDGLLWTPRVGKGLSP